MKSRLNVIEEQDIPIFDLTTTNSSGSSSTAPNGRNENAGNSNVDQSLYRNRQAVNSNNTAGGGLKDGSTLTLSSVSLGNAIGYVRAQIRFEEDTNTLYKSSEPLCVPPAAQEQVNVCLV